MVVPLGLNRLPSLLLMDRHFHGRGRCLGCCIHGCAREAESDRHDQQTAKHEANAGHGRILEVMASNIWPDDLFPQPTHTSWASSCN